MDSGFKPILIALLLTGLFAIAVINAGIMIAEQNNFEGSIGDDPSISSYRDSISSNISKLATDAGTSDSVLSNSTITTTTSTPFIDSIGGIWKTVRVVPITIWDLTMGIVAERFLGEDKKIVITVLAIIMSLTLIFAIIYLIATGDGRR